MNVLLTPVRVLIFLSLIFSITSYPLNSQIDDTRDKRFAVPFPDMHRFLSTSHKLHKNKPSIHGNTKQDFHAYLCSIAKDSEEMSNFLGIFVEEHGQAPAFNLFESCESARLNKRWKSSVEGPMAIDYINQMLEARKVQSYPYSSEIDPYLVGR